MVRDSCEMLQRSRRTPGLICLATSAIYRAALLPRFVHYKRNRYNLLINCAYSDNEMVMHCMAKQTTIAASKRCQGLLTPKLTC